MENTTAQYWVNKNPCLITVGGNIQGGDNHYSFAVRRGDPLTQEINTALAELKADGTVQKLQEKWWPPAEPKPADLDCSAIRCGPAAAVVLSILGVLSVARFI